jgi:hypothetical protein
LKGILFSNPIERLKNVNELEHLAQALRSGLPGADIQIDPSEKEAGVWFLDVASGGRLVIVEWDRSKGFQVSMITADVPYEDGADEIFASVIDAGRRVFEFLDKKLTDSASSVG